MLEEWKNGIIDTESFAAFFENRMICTGDDNDVLLASTIYNTYTKACDPAIKPISMAKMKEFLEKKAGAKWFRKHSKHDGPSLSAYKGIRMLDAYEEDET